MEVAAAALVFALALVVLAWATRRALRVLVVELRAGRVVSARGRASAELMREIGDVAERSGATGRVELRLEGGRVAVRTVGLDEATTQRLRNVVGRFPTARLKTGTRR